MTTGVPALAAAVNTDSSKLALETRVIDKALDAEVGSAAKLIAGFTKVSESIAADPDPSKGRQFDGYA